MFTRRFPAWVLFSLLVLHSTGCFLMLRPPVSRGMRISNDRFEVARVNRGQLTVDQRGVLDEEGTPEFIVFEEELETGKAVQRWVYSKKELQVVFLEGKKVDYVVVQSSGRNPLLDASAGEQGPLLLAWQWFQLVGHWLRD